MNGRRDVELLLLLFHLNNGSITGRKRIQKLVFLLKRQSKIPFSFDFKPYFYGPYSENLAQTIQFLTGFGLLKERVLPHESGFVQYSYSLTPDAKRMLRNLKVHIPANLKQGVTKLSQLSTTELVRLSKTLLS